MLYIRPLLSDFFSFSDFFWGVYAAVHKLQNNLVAGP